MRWSRTPRGESVTRWHVSRIARPRVLWGPWRSSNACEAPHMPLPMPQRRCHRDSGYTCVMPSYRSATPRKRPHPTG